MRVLIVEDDHFYGTQLAELVRDRGAEPEVVPSVEEALERDRESFGAVIVDVMLPNDPDKSGISAEATRAGFSSGVALCRELKRRGFKGSIILISAGIFGVSGDAKTWADENDVPFISKDEGPKALLRVLERVGIISGAQAPKAFIVHGHDEQTLSDLKDYLQNTLKWQEPMILREQPSRGKTIIEKFEESAPRIDCVFVLLTPDDPGMTFGTDDDRRRARQNVIFEFGFFYSQMGRKTGRVIALRKGDLDIPSDIQGVIWIDISNGIKAAGEDIRKEVAHLCA
jgi:CheY-like chemotaxis protein